MENVGEASNNEVLAIYARRILGVEEGAKEAARMVVIVAVIVTRRGRPAIDQGRALIGAVGRLDFLVILASDFSTKLWWVVAIEVG
jgi:hypothetical protein